MPGHSCRAATVVRLVGLFAVVALRPALAEPVRIDLFGEISESSLPTALPGDPVTIAIYVDSETPDEDAAAGAYAATAPGTGEFQWKDATPGPLDVLSISADTSSGEWTGNLSALPPEIGYPVTISLNGLGMTSDQILPDFTSFTTGTALFDASWTAYAFVVLVDVQSVEVVTLPDPPPVPVPAAATGSRLLLGVGILASVRRSSSRRRRAASGR